MCSLTIQKVFMHLCYYLNNNTILMRTVSETRSKNWKVLHHEKSQNIILCGIQRSADRVEHPVGRCMCSSALGSVNH